MQIKRKAYLYLVTSMLIGSFTPVLLLSIQGTNAFELFFLAALGSIPVGMAVLKNNGKLKMFMNGVLANKRILFYMAAAALLMFVPYEYGIAYAEHYISASLAIVLFRLNPLLMLLLIPVFLRERLTRKQIIALVIAFFGILIGITQGSLAVVSSGNLFVVLFVVLLAFGFAMANILIKKEMFDREIFLTTSGFVLALFFGIAFLVTGAQFEPLSAVDLGIIAYIAVTNILSYYMYIYALKILRITVVSNTFLISPFFSFIWAFLVYGQAISAYYLVIAALVSAGIVIQNNDQVGGSYLPKKSEAAKAPYKFVIFDVTGAFADSEVQPINAAIQSGGRVFATKVESGSLGSASELLSGSNFSNVYSGEEVRRFKETAFVKDVLGVNEGEIVIIKAGSSTENEDFFHELNRHLGGDDES